MEGTKKAESQLDNILKRITGDSSNRDHQRVADWAIENAENLVMIFDGKSGPTLELARFANLPEDRLVNMESYVGPSQDRAFPLPNMANEMRDREADFPVLVEKWQRSLKKYRSKSQTQFNLDQDAYVLATLQWVNQQLEAEKKKVVLITGTSSIWKAANRDEHKICSNFHRNEPFSKAYIRYPLAFLADSHFFFRESRSTPEPTFKLMDWLNLGFPGMFKYTGVLVADSREFPDSDLIDGRRDLTDKERAQAQESDLQRDANSILTEWRTQVGAAATSRKINTEQKEWSDRATDLINWLCKQTGAGWSVKQFRSDINRRAMDSLSALYSSTFWISLWARISRLPDQARGIPALRFEKQYTNAQIYCKQLIDVVRRDEGSHRSNEAIDLQKIYEDIRKDDPTHYHCHVIHALAYAIKGHWYAAQTLCKVAIRIAKDIVEHQSEEHPYIRGREAAYLLAIAERRMAREASDLESAENNLKQARDRENPNEPDDVRFKSEEFAQKTAKFNFRFFVDKDTAAVEELSLSFLDDGFALFSSLCSEPIEEIQDWVGQQLVTNLLDVGMAIYSVGPPQSLAAVEVTRKVLEYIEGSARLRDTIAKDEVANFLYTASLAIFSVNSEVRKDENKRLVTLHFPKTRPYDRSRKDFFMKLASQANPSGA